MLAAASIGSGLSTPGWCSSRRRIRRLRRASWRWTLAFTRKPPGGEPARVVNHLDCSLKPGGFRVSLLQRFWGYAWLRPRFRPPDGKLQKPLNSSVCERFRSAGFWPGGTDRAEPSLLVRLAIIRTEWPVSL